MAANDYHFLTHWRVAGTATEVADILDDAASLPRWWPTVYLRAQEIEPGDAEGNGKVFALLRRAGCLTPFTGNCASSSGATRTASRFMPPAISQA